MRGNDQMYFRGNYQKGRTGYSNAKLIVPSNWVPRYKAGDTVLENCIVQIPFEARFVPEHRLGAEKLTTEHCNWMMSRGQEYKGAQCTFAASEQVKSLAFSRAGLNQFFYWCARGTRRF